MPRRGRPKLPADPCLSPGCGRIRGDGPNTRGGRGVCKRCYSAYAYLVRTGQTTWDELERKGLVLAPSLPFRRRLYTRGYDRSNPATHHLRWNPRTGRVGV